MECPMVYACDNGSIWNDGSAPGRATMQASCMEIGCPNGRK